VSAVVFAVISAVSIAVLVKIFVIVIKIVAVVEIVVSNTRSHSPTSRENFPTKCAILELQLNQKDLDLRQKDPQENPNIC